MYKILSYDLPGLKEPRSWWHWHTPLVPHICVRELGQHWLSQAITWTNADLLPIGPLETKLSEIEIKIQNFFFHENACKKCRLGNGGHFIQGEMRWIGLQIYANESATF